MSVLDGFQRSLQTIGNKVYQQVETANDNKNQVCEAEFSGSIICPVRQLPNIDAPIVCSCTRNSRIYVYVSSGVHNSSGFSFYKVNVDGYVGYMSVDCLKFK